MAPPPDAAAPTVAPVEPGWPRPGPAIASLPESFRSISVPTGPRFWRKMLAFAGPGGLIAVGYMDPGNWATDIAGGSQFGYVLLPVIVLSNFIAMFLQHLSLKLGVASGYDLAQACRERFNRPTAFVLWVAAEIAIIACDLAEVLGTAVALKLLFGIPMLWGVGLTVIDSLIILGLMQRGVRYIEAFITSLLVLIGGCFVVELVMARPDFAAMGASFTTPGEIATDPRMLYLALGIFGATVMPHNLYLHSSLAQTRRYAPTVEGKREAIKLGTIDSNVALMLALFVNGAILVLAAAAFHASGLRQVVELADAHRLPTPLFGTAAAGVLFAVALLASGQNSTITGALAGQVVMEGMLGLKMSPLLRRLLTRGLAIAPVFGVIAWVGEGGVMRLLILSQVVLSLQLAFAVIPLVMFTSDKAMMGPFVNRGGLRSFGFVIAALIVSANGWLVIKTFTG